MTAEPAISPQADEAHQHFERAAKAARLLVAIAQGSGFVCHAGQVRTPIASSISCITDEALCVSLQQLVSSALKRYIDSQTTNANKLLLEATQLPKT